MLAKFALILLIYFFVDFYNVKKIPDVMFFGIRQGFFPGRRAYM